VTTVPPALSQTASAGGVWPVKAQAAPAATFPADRQITTLQKIGFATLAIFIVTSYSRLVDMIAIVTNLKLPTAQVTIALALFGMVLCGLAVLRNLDSVSGRLMLLYTIWLVLTIPVSTWRGGSYGVFRQMWLPSVMAFVFLSTMVLSFQYLRRVIFLIVFSVGLILFMSPFLGGEIEGRFGWVAGTLRNANDFAMHLLFVLPFCLYLAKDPSSARSTRIFGWAVGLGILLVSLRTASRTGLLIILVYLAVLFITTSIVNKLKIVVAVISLGVLFIATLPQQTLVRYATLFTDSHDSGEADSEGTVLSAQESTALRERLFRYSLEMAMQHPIFGVGMGNFAGVAQEKSSKGPESTAWRQPHNVYNQIAAEVGFPGLILYVGIVAASFRACFRVRKAARRVPSQASRYNLANCLLLTLLAFAVTNFLATSAYGWYLPLFAGLAVLLERHAPPASSRAVPAPASAFPL